MNTPIVKVPSTGQMVTRTVKKSPQTSVMKVVPGKNQSKRTTPRDIKGTQVSGSNQYGPSENTRSQTKDRRTDIPRLLSKEPCVIKKGLAKSPTEVPGLHFLEPCVVGKGLAGSPTS